MKQEDNIVVPRRFLEDLENTLQIQYNINESIKKKTGDSCQDRNIKQSLNGIRKLLKGEELTGIERLEKLQPSVPSNLDDAAKLYVENYGYTKEDYQRERIIAEEHFKAGAQWNAVQGWIDDGSLPPEHKDVCTGCMVSDRVLAWDSMYGARVDFTLEGKWTSETLGGYTGQLCHSIVAWRPISGYNE